jgi:hypothetical protein
VNEPTYLRLHAFQLVDVMQQRGRLHQAAIERSTG